MNPEHAGRCAELHEHLPCDVWDSTIEGSCWALSNAVYAGSLLSWSDLGGRIASLLGAVCSCDEIDATALGESRMVVRVLNPDCPVHGTDGAGDVDPDAYTAPEPPARPLGFEDFADVRRGLGTER